MQGTGWRGGEARQVFALTLGGTAAFVAATGICIPSMLFTAVSGIERACGATLVARQPAEGRTR